MRILAFTLGSQAFALPLDAVQEVVRAVQIVPLPRTPSIVEGVIDVRGRLTPVLDIRTRFGLPPRALQLTDQFILAWDGPRPVCLRTEHVIGLREVEAGQLKELEEDGPTARGGPYIAGVASLDDGLVLIHDLQTFLTAAEAGQLDAALAEGADAETASL